MLMHYFLNMVIYFKNKGQMIPSKYLGEPLDICIITFKEGKSPKARPITGK